MLFRNSSANWRIDFGFIDRRTTTGLKRLFVSGASALGMEADTGP
ncbi:MAG TPA: hypothetical protein VIJ27_09075 [Mucilaginibacter sp.]|jgi:hypothetical protein